MRRFFGFLLLLCLFFRAAGQGLQVGERVPDVAGLGRLRGQLVLLDFWATWCAPCRALVLHNDSLNRVFAGRAVVVPVAYERMGVALPVLRRIRGGRLSAFPEVFGDTVLVRLFPHRSLPHYVWIGADGRVAAITGMEAVTAEGIGRMLEHGSLEVRMKRDTVVRYDGALPLLAGGNGGGAGALRYHSLLTGYLPGLSGGLRIGVADSVRGQLFTVRNVPFVSLCRLAFGEEGWLPDSRVRVESRDSALLYSHLTGAAYEDWLAAGHGYCYELLAPPGTGLRAFGWVREDLRRLFPQYAVSMEPRELRCLALVWTDTVDHLKSGGGKTAVEIGPFKAHLVNAHLSQLMMRLQLQYLQRLGRPLVDATGYAGRVDMDLDADLSNIWELNKALARYGLAFEERVQRASVLVIRDKK